MKNKVKHILAALTGCMLVGLSVPAYAHASDGEDYITISVDAVDNSGQMQYAIDSDDPSAFSNINEFTIPTGTSHTIYVKDAAGKVLFTDTGVTFPYRWDLRTGTGEQATDGLYTVEAYLNSGLYYGVAVPATVVVRR